MLVVYEVREDGIYAIYSEGNGIYSEKCIIPKEIFIEAFNKYVGCNDEYNNILQ